MKMYKIGCIQCKYVFILLLLIGICACKKQECHQRKIHSQSGVTFLNGSKCDDGMRNISNNQKFERIDLDDTRMEQIRRLFSTTNRSFSESRIQSSDFVMNVLKNCNASEAYLYCDCLLELAINHDVTAVEYISRQNQLAICWYNARNAFIGAQKKNGNDYMYWEKIFRFYKKYVNEILSVVQLIENPKAEDQNVSRSVKNVNKNRYLFLIQDDLKAWVRVMRDFEFPSMSKHYTPEQKSDILRRFNEIEKYTTLTPMQKGE